jgi:hypothetical protein
VMVGLAMGRTSVGGTPEHAVTLSPAPAGCLVPPWPATPGGGGEDTLNEALS